jgi:hypothetical protein
MANERVDVMELGRVGCISCFGSLNRHSTTAFEYLPAGCIRLNLKRCCVCYLVLDDHIPELPYFFASRLNAVSLDIQDFL